MVEDKNKTTIATETVDIDGEEFEILNPQDTIDNGPDEKVKEVFTLPDGEDYEPIILDEEKPQEELPTTLNPDEEKQFQSFMATNPDVLKWQSEFEKEYGSLPNTESKDYDYRGAWKAGIIPQQTDNDPVPHWGSIGINGKELKSKDHPTRWKSDYMEATGKDPDQEEVTKADAIKVLKDRNLPVDHLMLSTELSDDEVAPALKSLRENSPLKFNEEIDKILKDEMKFETLPPMQKKEKDTYLGDFMERIGSGGLSGVSSLFKIPALLYDINNFPKQAFEDFMISRQVSAGQLTKEEGLKASQLLKEISPGYEFGEMLKEDVAENAVTRFLDDNAKKLRSESNRYDKSIEAYMKLGQWQNAIGAAGLGAGEALIPSVVAGFSGPVGLVVLGASAGAEKKFELDKVSDVPESIRTVNAMTTFALEYVTERVGTAHIGALVKGTIKNFGKKEGVEILKNGFKSSLGSYIKKLGLYTAPIREGLSEGVNGFGENVNDYITGVDIERNLFKGVVDKIAIGAVMGAPATAFQAASDVTTKVKAKKGQAAMEEMMEDIAVSKYGQVDPQEKVIPEEAAREQKIDPATAEFQKEVQDKQAKLDEMKAKGEDVSKIPFAEIDAKFEEFKAGKEELASNFETAGIEAKSKKDGKILGRWILDNSKVGDTITDADGNGYEVTYINSKGQVEITAFELNEKGKREYFEGEHGVRLVSESKLNQGDLFEYSYTNIEGDKVTEQYSYNKQDGKESISEEVQRTEKLEVEKTEPIEKTEFQVTADQLTDEIIETSKDPDEVAATYLQELDKPANISHKEDIISKHMSKIKRKGYEDTGDKGNLQRVRQIIPNYFDKTGKPIDDEAQFLSGIAKVEITPQDIVDFIDKHPNGLGSVDKSGGRSSELARQFKQLTKKKLTPELAKEITKLTPAELQQAEGMADEAFGPIQEKGVNSETIGAFENIIPIEDIDLLKEYYNARDKDKTGSDVAGEIRPKTSKVVAEKPTEEKKPKTEPKVKTEEVRTANSTESIEKLVDEKKASLVDEDVQVKIAVADKNNWHDDTKIDKDIVDNEIKKEEAKRQFKKGEFEKKQKAKESGFNFLGIQRYINPKGRTFGGFIKKYFGREKGLPSSVFEESMNMEGRLRARQYDIEKSIDDSFKAIKEAFGEKLTLENLADLQNVIENIGQTETSLNEAIAKFGENIPKEAIPTLIEMRRQIDAATDEIGRLNMIGISLKEKFDKNRGYHITRTYKKHTDKNWVWDEIPAKIKSDAFGVVMDLNPEFSVDEANGFLRSLLETKDITESVISSSNSLNDIDKSVLKKRSKFLTDNPEIRNFLGENRNPFYNYAVSLAKMSEMIERGKMIENFVDAGIKEGWLSKTPSDKNNLLARIRDDSRYSWKPGTEKLSDFYTTPEIAEAMVRNVNGDPITNKLMRAYMTLVTTTKIAKTAGSIKGLIRNFKANLPNAIGNGNWNLHQITPELNRRLKPKNRREFIRELYEKSIIGDSANAGEVVRNVKDLTNKLTFITNAEEGFLPRTGKKGLRAMLATYGFADDVWKAYRYVSEYTRYNKVFSETMSEADALSEAKNKAADVLHKTSTYYSQLPLAITRLRRLPFMNTFVSFPYLTITNFIGSVSVGVQEMKSSELRHIGIQRLGGLALGTSALALNALLRNRSNGVDEEEEESWRRFLPDFWKNDIVIFNKIKDGKALYSNQSYMEYYGSVTKPLLMLQRKLSANGKLESKDLTDAAKQFFSNFLSWDIVFDRVTNLTKNTDRATGFDIYNEKDTILQQWKDISKYMLETIEPGTITDARRIYRDWRRGEDWQAKAVGVLKGSQIRTIDPVKSLDKYKLYDYKDGINKSRKIYKDALRKYKKLRSPDETDKDVLKDAKARSLNAINGIVNEIRDDMNALRVLGIKDAKSVMNKLIRDKRFDSDIRKAVVKNKKLRLTDDGSID